MKLVAEIQNSDGSIVRAELEIKIMKNIFIVLDFDGKNESDKDRDKIEFRDLVKIGWHGIYAMNLFDAEKQLLIYLGGDRANNIVLLSHGGGTNSGYVALISDNNYHITIGSSDLEKVLNKPNEVLKKDPTMYSEIDLLKSIIHKIEDTGNFVLASCNSALSDKFLGNLQLLTGSRISMYGMQYSSMIAHKYEKDNGGVKTGLAYIDADDLLQYSFVEREVEEINEKNYYGNTIGEAKLFPRGWKNGDRSISLEDLGITYNGICVTE